MYPMPLSSINGFEGTVVTVQKENEGLLSRLFGYPTTPAHRRLYSMKYTREVKS